MSKMKKFLVCLLTAAMVTTSVVPAFAASTSAQDNPTEVELPGDKGSDAVGHGIKDAYQPDKALVKASDETKSASLSQVKSTKKTVKVSLEAKAQIGSNKKKFYPVTVIGKNAFSKCKKATKIELKGNEKTKKLEIRKNAFSGCKKDVKITIGITTFSKLTLQKNAFGKNTKKMTVTYTNPSKKKGFTSKQYAKVKKLMKACGFKGTMKIMVNGKNKTYKF